MSDTDPNLTSRDDSPTLPPKKSSELSRANADLPTLAPGNTASEEVPARSGAAPQLEGFEILDELGRGGMGVVYKARNTRLERTVALKMILGGKLASAADIERFRIEAESAARLDHPNIVPIFEIGEFDGNHFFSMKYIEGAPLSERLADYQDDQRKSAELMIKIAAAVQHAHQRGVLHRDLKPANVLIDADGEPAITDLGLAKRLDGDSELTKTGLVMGSPGFMAPEQAAGEKEVTTATDVFSLGAMLFWMITGRPPFEGDNAVQIVMNTIEGDVPSIRTTIPAADRDLDLICRKAMHKEQSGRYSSAAEFANDLQAWLDGDALSVRAPSTFDLASSWIRKNMRAVAGAVIAGVLCGVCLGGLIAAGEILGALNIEDRVQELGSTAGTWIDNLRFLRKIPDYWDAYGLLVVPAVAASAFLCVLLVRPQTRESNIVAAVTSGLIAGIVAFVIGVGWGPMETMSNNAASSDIEALSRGVWMNSAEQEALQDAMLRRYPGLEDMDKVTRRQRMIEKIRHEHVTNLMPGVWYAIGVMILFVCLPMLFTTILSGMLWQEGIRGGQWFGCTWERSAYCLLSFLAISFFLRPVKPTAWLVFVVIAAMLFALYLAVRHAHWFWRVVMIPVPFVGMAMLNDDVQKQRFAPREIAQANDQDGIQAGIRLCEKYLQSKPDDEYRRYLTAIAYLYSGDKMKYREHCRESMGFFGNTLSPEVASRLVKLHLLDPDFAKELDLDLMTRYSEFATAFESETYSSWFFSTRALLEMRKENWEQVLAWNAESREQSGPNERSYLVVLRQLTDAIALFRQGKVSEAKTAFEKGKTIGMALREEDKADGVDSSWVDWMIFEIINAEASELMATETR